MRVLALMLALVSSAVFAAEGMWTLDNLPREQLKKQYQFAPDKAWAGHVMKGSARIAGGCSASFVSKDGLVLTNHHCVNECVQQLSSGDKDFIRDGFLAQKQEDEVRCPEIELNRLEEISDITPVMKKALAGKSGADFATARKAQKAKLESACIGEDKETTRCDVVELYHGGQYALYKYHRFQDVRLVFAPELAAAFFGGDPDNFNFPRYNLDMGLLRAYEDDEPAAIEDFFPFKSAGAQPGELTLVTGHPGSTQRQLTLAQLELLRDFILPTRLFDLAELRGLLTQFSAESEEHARIAQNDLFSIENSLKARKGMFEALLDPEVFNFKRKQEAALRAFVGKDKSRKAAAGKAWDEIAAAQKIQREIYVRYRRLDAGTFATRYFEIARALVRGAAEREKPNAERLEEFTDAALPSLTQNLFSTAPVEPDLEQVKFTWALTKLRESLSQDDEIVQQVLGAESPSQVAERMIKGTKLADVAERKRLWEGGALAIEMSTDPFIQLAVAVDAEARAIRQRYEDEVEAVEQKNAEKIAAARFAMKGTGTYPDATFTLRLSYGEVKGWNENGEDVEPFTTLGGGFERATGSDPFRWPDSWTDKQDQLNADQRFNFVTTNDIIGGNSGSPVINKKAEIVGLVFDGNIRSLGGAYWFDERVNRTVAVHSGAILEALRKIYGADALADEMEGKE
ncbi:MAG: S46 family peptidase [Pseudomonadota bacterium]